ncbi:protelomerase family protein [Pseudoalteromonas marina]|uniref:protelomerase family protein n=1 Tax=Pseudoalteromonas marina TaxID=267375 RepID=UPI003C651B4E
MIDISKRIATFKSMIISARTKNQIDRLCKSEYEYLENKGYAPSTIRSFFTQYRKEILPRYKQTSQKYGWINGTNDESSIKSGVMIRGLRVPIAIQAQIKKKTKEAVNQNKIALFKGSKFEGVTINDLHRYIRTSQLLIKSDKWQNVAVGLMALTGRRPTEILKTAIFTDIGEKYQLHFEGQLKKKQGSKTDYNITTIVPSDYIIKGLNRLRKLARQKNWQSMDNGKVNSSTSKTLATSANNYLVQCLEIDQMEIKDLRKAYAEITFQRELMTNPTKSDSKSDRMNWYAKQLGHFDLETNEPTKDSESSSAHYEKFRLNEQGKAYIKANLID